MERLKTRNLCEYFPEILKKYAGNWLDNCISSGISKGVPKISLIKWDSVKIPGLKTMQKAETRFYHGLTQQSHDTITIVEKGFSKLRMDQPGCIITISLYYSSKIW